MRRRLTTALLVIAIAACAGRAGPAAPPSEVEALQYLEAAIAMVQSGNASRICELGPPSCPQTVEPLDQAAVPSTRPSVIRVRTRPGVVHGDGTWSNGSVIIELCGVDGLGKPYQSDMQVYWHEGRIVSTVPAYWLGIQFAEDPVVGAPDGPIGACRLD
jgi:hypothetical protein